MIFIALPIGFYCRTGRNKQTTSIRYASPFATWKEAAEEAKVVSAELNLSSYTIICSLEKEMRNER